MDEKYDNEIAYSYDDYLKSMEDDWEEWLEDDIYEETKIQEMFEMEDRIMNREILDAKNLTLEKTLELVDYIWQGNKLIPVEMIEGE